MNGAEGECLHLRRPMAPLARAACSSGNFREDRAPIYPACVLAKHPLLAPTGERKRFQWRGATRGSRHEPSRQESLAEVPGSRRRLPASSAGQRRCR
ncbi:MAG TPA: hypothetical protein VFU13_00935 [Steroidobacteraceae bacterium]|nr:hypothetical protein [Steroidobacteraceae bacterium]